MHKAIEQEVSVLSSSKHGLVYLTPNDWTLVADKASRVNFRKGETLVHKGKTSEWRLLVGERNSTGADSVANRIS